jgi:hypothetical protein
MKIHHDSGLPESWCQCQFLKKLLFSGGGLVIPPENQSVRVSGTFGNTGKSGEGVTPECQTKKTAVSGLKT